MSQSPAHNSATARLRWAREHDDQPGRRRRRFAEEVFRAAEEHGIELSCDQQLLDLLAQVHLHRDIPAETYRGLTALLSFIHKLLEPAEQLSPAPDEQGECIVDVEVLDERECQALGRRPQLGQEGESLPPGPAALPPTDPPHD